MIDSEKFLAPWPVPFQLVIQRLFPNIGANKYWIC